MRARIVASAFIATVALAACDDLLEVTDPQRFTDEALNDPTALPAVANGVEGRVHGEYDNIIIHTGLLGDELMHTGTWAGYEDSDQGRHRPGVGNDVSASELTKIRLEAQKAEERFVRVLGDSAYRSTFMAQVKAMEGWTNVLIGMVACESIAEPNGPAVSDTAMFQAAIPILTEAIEIAQAADEPVYKNLALAGRARANLLSGNHDAALADARAVEADFEYFAEYSEQGVGNSLVTLNHYSENKAAGLDARRWDQVDTVSTASDLFIDVWSGQPDPRVPLRLRVGNRLGVDGRTKFFSQDKYTTRETDIPLTHWREMRLIEAEVYWRRGDFATAIARMNGVRAEFGLPALENPNTSDGVLDRLLEERFATLFLEGHRASDLYRFELFREVIGEDFNTKFPMDDAEYLNNPNLSRVRPCPNVS